MADFIYQNQPIFIWLMICITIAYVATIYVKAKYRTARKSEPAHCHCGGSCQENGGEAYTNSEYYDYDNEEDILDECDQ